MMEKTGVTQKVSTKNLTTSESVFHGAKSAKVKQKCKFEARNPKYETNYNYENTNVQNN